MALDDRIYTRIGKEEKIIFQYILKKKLQNQNVVVRSFVRSYIKDFFVEEIKKVTLPAEKAEVNAKLKGNVDIIFTFEKVECKQDGKTFTSLKWDDIFESKIELLEYALDA